MAFTNLFSKLSAVNVKRPDQPASTFRNNTGHFENGERRKRKSDQHGPYMKRQYHQATSVYFGNSKAVKDQVHNDYEHASGDFTKGMASKRANGRCNEQFFKTTQNVNKQQKRHRNRQWRPPRQGDGNQNGNLRMNKGGSKNRKNMQVARVKTFSQEFLDHHAVLFDGRHLCRFFLLGKCTMSDSCQLEHIESFNDIFKECCKFYIQGLCTKGESCPYMHKSFPCKHYHRGRCRRQNCAFSHEPLNDVTTKLLDEAIKKDIEYAIKLENELAQKTEQTSSVQQVTADKPEITPVNDPPDKKTTQADVACDPLAKPLRFNFYNSAESNAIESKLIPTEDALVVEEEMPPEGPADLSPTAPLTHLHPAAPVCYSVEALLGRQLSSPLSGAFQTPTAQDDSTPVPATTSDCSSWGNPSKVPISVDAVLKSPISCNSALRHTLPTVTGTLQSVFYTPTALPEQSLASQNDKVSGVLSAENKAFKKTLQEVRHDSKEPASSHAEYKTACRETANVASSVGSGQGLKPGKGTFHSLFSSTPSVASSPKPSTVFTSHRSHKKSDSQHTVHPFSHPCERSKQLKDDFAAVEPSIPSTEIIDPVKRNSLLKNTQSETLPHCNSAGPTDPLDSPPGYPKPMKKTFKSLFAGNITGTSTTPASPHGLIPSNGAVECQNILVKSTVGPDQARAGFLRSLFATSLPGVPSQPHHSVTSCPTLESGQPAKKTLPLSDGVSSCVPQAEVSPKNTTANKDKRLVDVVIKAPIKHESKEKPYSGTCQRLVIMPADVDSAPAATSKTALKTLFLSLSPFRQDGK
ncbi:uncharacterized protein LOC133557640 [Nerophis ophidion]|uniref:uncharacterized protein LOC133557640 n=1 Tax=Nerophis ophidion TaxID=159077 RepID=UPI002ADFEBC4|nr:uncharacterized protein LOC133557640 [Nerophis ophidion]